MLELLQWVHLNAQRVEVVQNASNFLIILYFTTFIINKKSFYIGAFLLIEFMGASSLMDWSCSELYYLMYAGLYSLCYWYEAVIGKNIKIMLAYGIMIIFQSTMVLDAYIYPDIATRIYYAYEFVVVGIHIYIVIMLTNFRRLWQALGDSFNSVLNLLSVGYNMSFCYTVNTILNQIKKTCH